MSSEELDDKWEEVKDFYEKNYRGADKRPIRFKKRLSDSKIIFLHEQMVKLSYSVAQYINSASRDVQELAKDPAPLPTQLPRIVR